MSAAARPGRLRITVLGTGRVGSALAHALADRDVPVHLQSSRSPDRAAALLGDLTVLAVSDDAIGPVAAALAEELEEPGGADPGGGGVVHCSGALGRAPLAPLARLGRPTGAWHPLQAFARPDTPVLAGVAWGTTADDRLVPLLDRLTSVLGGRMLPLAEEARAQYHAAAAIASNYADVLVHHAALLLQDCGLDRDAALHALLPLVRTSLDGLELAGLPDGLTGPLSRGDLGTVRRHLAALAGRPETERLYREAGLAALPLLRERGMDRSRRDAILSVLRHRDTPTGTSGA